MSQSHDTNRLRELSALIESVQAKGESQANVGRSILPTGWVALDTALGGIEGGLKRGAVHEWLGTVGVESPRTAGTARRGWGLPDRDWRPPLCVLTHLAWQAASECRQNAVVWIGRRCMPNAALLSRRAGGKAADRRLMDQSIFVDAGDDCRLWAIDLAIRCPAAGVVIADGSGLDMAATRRLQLACAASGGTALLARPARDLGVLSAAATRWLVRLASSPARASWTVELVRCKASRAASVRPRWSLEWDCVQNAVRISSELRDGPGASEAPAERVARRIA